MEAPETIVFNGFFKIKIRKIQDRFGNPYSYEILDLPSDAVMILAQDAEKRFILNWEYRQACEKFILGCPGGLIDPNESILEAGKRELLEETGYYTDNIIILGSSYPFAGVCSQKIHFLFAACAKPIQKPNLDPTENISVKLMTEDEISTFVKEGNPLDGILASIFWFKKNHERTSANKTD